MTTTGNRLDKTRLTASFHLLSSSVFRWGLAAILVVSASSPALAQFTVFGKNKVQYNDLEWFILRTDHFDIYYYPEEEELAHRTQVWVEESYDELAGFFGFEVRRRVPLIIYSTHRAFQQTNVTPFFLPEGVAGLTEFMKGRVLMPFNGSYSQFRNTLHHELVHVFQLSMISTIQRKYFRHQMANTPLWFSEGLADYLSEPWKGGAGEMILSDLVVEGNLPAIDELWRYNGTFALYKLGQRLVGYLVETYGVDVINRIYENLWVSASFNGVLQWVTGTSPEELSTRWHLWEKRHYYPRVETCEPLSLTARMLTSHGAEFKPLEVPPGILGDERKFVFMSPRSGYTNIYAASLDGKEKDVEILLEGEREALLEALHPFQSKLDISPDGLLVFVSVWHERDALLLYDLRKREIVGRYQFERLVGLTSPVWSADGRLLAFQGLSDDAYSDLYLFEPATGTLTRLTNDVYQDQDPDFSPDGRTLVFSSDRTEFGHDGNKNLFLMDLATRDIRYLTRGPWTDISPRYAVDGQSIYFTSTRSDLLDLYQIDLAGNGRQLTRLLTGGMDPSPTLDGEELLFTGYDHGRYRVCALDLGDARSRMAAEGGEVFALADVPTGVGWAYDAPAPSGRGEAARYSSSFGLDFAAGGLAYDPINDGASGIQLSFSDMLGDEVINVAVGNTIQRGTAFFDQLNAAVSYLNRRRRVTHGLGAFHFSGDYIDSRDFVFFERRAGVSLLASYPFSKFRRVESALGVAYSDKRHIADGIDRRAYLLTNFISWVHDNSLWLPTGPIDGERVRVTFGMTLDAPRAEIETIRLLVDYRKYLRAGQYSAWAVRVNGRISQGSDPTYFTIGGTHSLRGYPYRTLFGTRTLLINNEYRFPLIHGFLFGFPFGNLAFPGVEAALFADAGWLWNEGDGFPWEPLGSVGVSFRMAFGGLLVFRLDLARRTNFVTEFENQTRSDFFIGWNY